MGVERFYNSVEFEFQWRRDVIGKATSDRRGLWALMSWCPEKMLIRCRKESHYPAEWPLDLQIPLTVKPHTTFSNPCNKVRGKYFIKEVFLRLSACVCLYYCVVMMLHEHVYDNITYPYLSWDSSRGIVANRRYINLKYLLYGQFSSG